MVDETDNQEQSDEPETDWKIRIVWIAVWVLVLGFGAWVLRTRLSHPEANQAMVAALTKELDVDRQALQDQRSKVVELTERITAYRLAIDQKQVQDVQKAVDEHNALAREQQAERQKYADMAAKYNAKVARLHQMQGN